MGPLIESGNNVHILPLITYDRHQSANILKEPIKLIHLLYSPKQWLISNNVFFLVSLVYSDLINIVVRVIHSYIRSYNKPLIPLCDVINLWLVLPNRIALSLNIRTMNVERSPTSLLLWFSTFRYFNERS